MRIRPFQALYPDFDFIASPDSFCADVKHRFREFQKGGFFVPSAQPALFVYAIQHGTRRHLGLIAQNDVEDFFDGKIKKHEDTLREKEQHQMQMFLRWQAVLKPVLLTYAPVSAISDWLEVFTASHDPLFVTHFAREGQVHFVWPVTEPADIAAIQALFARHVAKAYIADGHHRTTTVALLYERLRDKEPVFDFSQLFCAFFSTDQLDILDYNRVVEGLGALTPAQFMVGLSHLFELDILAAPRKPLAKHEIVLGLGGDWYSLRWKAGALPDADEQVTLDATLLNERVLRDLLGIHDVRTDARITYVDGARGLEGVQRALASRPDRLAFLLYPVSFADMMQLADDGEMLPPKSTYFEPRMKSGLLVTLLKDEG